MSEFLQSDLGYQHGGSIAEVHLTAPANVLLLNARNLPRYTSGQEFSYVGCFATESPVHLEIPHSGTWYVVGDLGELAGRLEMQVCVIEPVR